MKRVWRARCIGIMIIIFSIYTIFMSYPAMVYAYLVSYPITIRNLISIYTNYIDKVGLSLTIMLLLLWVDEKIWGNPTSSSP